MNLLSLTGQVPTEKSSQERHYMAKSKLNVSAILKELGYGKLSNFGDVARAASERGFSSRGDLELWVEGLGLKPSEGGLRQEPRQNMLFLTNDDLYDLRDARRDPTKAAKSSIMGAVDQLELAMRLPVAMYGAGMPDIHKGYALPIGGVVMLDGAISPSFVGFDIGCQVNLSVFDVETKHALAEYGKSGLLEMVLDSTSFGVGSTSDNDHPIMDDDRWNIIKQHKSLAQSQLGSSGAGKEIAL
jgi:hypothetical protein